jgi:hypothetical protein
MATRDELLSARAAESHGVFTTYHARAAGIGSSLLTRRLQLGLYVRLYPGVYAFAGSVPTWHRRVAAAVEAVGPNAAASHQTAAELWKLTDRRRDRIEVVVRRWRRRHALDFDVHESLDLAPQDVVVHEGVRVTSAVRTVVDLGASSPWLVERALEQGIRAGLFGLSDVSAFVERVARRGRRGVGVIRPLLEMRERWDSVTESALEDQFRHVVDEAGLPEPVAQLIISDEADGFVCRADFAYPRSRVVIELDSEAHHMDRLAFRNDRAKQNLVGLLGWKVLRYTWWDLVERPAAVVSQVRALVAGEHA